MTDQIDGKAVERLAARLDDQQSKWMTPLLGEAAEMLRNLQATLLVESALLDGVTQRSKALLSERDALQAQVEGLTKSGICEVAAVNSNVMDCMRHWEGRAEKAEAALSAALAREGAVAMEVRERCATEAEKYWGRGQHAYNIRALPIPTDAAAALARREDEVWNEAIDVGKGKAKSIGFTGVDEFFDPLKRSAKDGSA